MTDATDELVAEMRAGLEGVTPGPWFKSGVRFRMGGGEWHSIARYDDLKKTDVGVAIVGFDPRTGEGMADANWIARCSPDNFAALLSRLDAETARADKAEKALRTVQNAAKTIAACQGTELEHLRQNATFDHRLRSQHESLLERDAQMTDALLAAEAEAARLAAELAEARKIVEPFAGVAARAESANAHFGGVHTNDVPDSQSYGALGITWGHLRTARAWHERNG